MRMRARGRTLYARNTRPITWSTHPPATDEPIYVVTWTNSQCRFMSARTIKGTK